MRGQPINVNAPGSAQTPENMQQMKKLMEQELKSDKYKSNSNKGYVFTLMPLYAIGVGVFAAYKFLKIKSADDQAQKDKFAKGAKKEPVKRAGTKASADREDAQFHPHTAGPAH